MKTLQLLWAAVIFALAAPVVFLSSCDDDTTQIGSSLITDKSEIVVDTVFTLEGQSIDNDIMSARTLTQLLGSIDAKGYGRLSSDYVTQLMPSSLIDTSGVAESDIDSVKLILRFYGHKITGDSLVPMGLKVFPLTRQLPDDINSSFNPADYYDPSASLGQKIYTSNALYSDSLNGEGVHVISVDLPVALGRHLYNLYKKSPETFLSPLAFAKEMPGLYIANSFGSGRVTNIMNTRLAIYYRSHQKYYDSDDVERDTIYNYARIIAASTPEVLTNNTLSFSMAPELSAMAQQGTPLIVAPLGLDVRFKMPVRQIVEAFRSHIQAGAMGVVNSLSVLLPAEKIENTYGIEPPEQLLIVLAKDREAFFNDNKVPDNINSYLATYNEASGGYVISGMRPYIMQFINSNLADLKDDDCIFIATPVDTETETITQNYVSYEVVTAVGPYIDGPAMVKIMLDEAKIRFTYSTETVNF